MSAIKRFFEKKKIDRKFKKAGEGHTLAGAAKDQPVVQQPAASSHLPGATHSPRPPTAAQQRAASAAVARVSAAPGENTLGLTNTKNL